MDLYWVRKQITSGVTIQELPLRVTFYARVSTDKDAQLHSLASQITYFQEYIQSVENWEFVDGYVDEGISGTQVFKRESFLQMIRDAKTDRFDLILTKEISRFSRSTLDSIQYTQELLQQGVGVCFLNDNINTIFPDSELRLTIMASVAQDEVRKLSERVHFGMNRSIEKGVVLGNSRIYGYRKDQGKLVVDEQEAPMIRLIFEQYANTTISLNGLTKLLYQRGYVNSRGKRFDATIVRRILENPKYKGYYCGRKSQVLDYRTKLKKQFAKTEWKVYKATDVVPALVSEELWEQANKKLRLVQQTRKQQQNRSQGGSCEYAYSGKLICGIHQDTYHRSAAGSRKERPVWECKHYRKGGRKACSNYKVIEQELDKWLRAYFRQYFETHSTLFSHLQELYLKRILHGVGQGKMQSYQEQIALFQKKKDLLLELVIEQRLSHEEFASRNAALNKKIVEHQTLLRNQEHLENQEMMTQSLKELFQNFPVDDFLSCFFSEMVELFVSKIEVWPVSSTSSMIRLCVFFTTGQQVLLRSDEKGRALILDGSEDPVV